MLSGSWSVPVELPDGMAGNPQEPDRNKSRNRFKSIPRLRQFEMNQNEPAIEEIRTVEMIRIDCHVDRLERCQTELIAGTLEDVLTMKWRYE
ncbi:hypothetical protein Y032_0109g106 [Ancylostoma ceylanicum]|uniref:Uncharacterized protein n=1 Tax=Ancylostoma ceylanicum TaxID=53326 RepID=A0A016TE10_9BILA|nr:hypothetical protein Y032_0109g106 [Ancylostoma ceylanicum]